MKRATLTALAVLAISACGGDDDAAPTTTRAPAARPTTTTTRPPLSWESPLELDITECNQDEVLGTVTNNSDERVDVFIDVYFFNGSGGAGVQLGDSLASVMGLAPGRTGQWDAPVLLDGRYVSCTAEIGDIYPAD